MNKTAPYLHGANGHDEELDECLPETGLRPTDPLSKLERARLIVP